MVSTTPAMMRLAVAGGALSVSALREASGINPVTKVVGLLEEMKAQVEEEATEDEKVFSNHHCWCETNEKEKKQAIVDGNKRLEDLAADIEEGTARAAQLETEIGELKDEIAANEEAVEKATQMRVKEKEEFDAEAADSMEAITAMKQAVKVLSKVQLVQKNAPAQVDSSDAQSADALVQVRSLVSRVASLRPTDSGVFKSVMQRDLWDMLGSLPGADSESNPRVITGLVEQPTGNAAGASSYSAQSSQIFGLLSEMKEEFERDLSAAQKQELNAEISFQKLKSAKVAEIMAAGRSLEEKTAELADTHQRVAQAKEDVELTTEQIANDNKFLGDLVKRCATADEEYAARQKTRNEEILAISETINILTGDESRDLFSKSMSFVQISSRHTLRRNLAMSPQRSRAVGQLLQFAKKYRGTSNGLAMATLAVSMKLDGFEKVKEMMDKMVAELKKQQKEEVEKHDTCNKDIDENEDETRVKDKKKEDLVALIKDLEAQIKQLTKDIEDLNASIAWAQVELKRASEDRKAENKEFQQVVADQRATVAILNKALDRLKSFYAPKLLLQRSARVQRHQQVQEPPPSAGKEYNKNAASGGVLSTIEMIIQEAEAADAEALKSEQESQAAYAELVANTNKELDDASNSVTQKTEEKAKADANRLTSEKDLAATLKILEDLMGVNAGLHQSCDYIIKNFNIRQQARQEEVEAIQEAKAILSGADFGL